RLVAWTLLALLAGLTCRATADSVPTTRAVIGPNVYLESVWPARQAVAIAVGERLARIGEIAAGAGALAVAPRQAVTWQPRDPKMTRRAVVEGWIVLRQGLLEHLLTREAAGKNHESIISGDFDAKHIHLALIGAGAQSGKPAQFQNDKGEQDFKPPTG